MECIVGTDRDQASLLPVRVEDYVARDAPLRVIDKGFDNGAHASACERDGIITCVPGQRTINNEGDGALFDRAAFTYEAASDSFVC